MKVIYRIVNMADDKFYVGSTNSPERRRWRHWDDLKNGRHGNRYLQRAWDKYGAEAFIFEIVEEVSDDTDLLAVENVWLAEHVGKFNCYNIARDATAPMLGRVGPLNPMWGKPGVKHTEARKLKMRRMMSGEGNPMYGKTFSHTPEAKKAISDNSWMKTPEGRAAKSAQMQGHPSLQRERTLEERAKISASLKMVYRNIENHPRYKVQHTDDTKAKISVSRKGKAAGEDHYRYGKTVSEEVRKKIGDTQRGVPKAPRVISEAGMAKIRAAAAAGHYASFKGKKHTEATRLKMSKAIYCETNGKDYPSITAARLELGIDSPTITKALKGEELRTGKFKGWVFRYKKAVV